MRRSYLFFLCAAALLLAPRTGRAWDATGHMLVDYVASRQLKPGVEEKIEALAHRIDTKYNDHLLYNIVTVGCLMDDMRSEPHYPYGSLHYVDVPYTPTASPFTVPDPPNILSAIDDAIATLKKAGVSEADRALATAMVMHFVGDIHQPLHCVDWNDKGGNGYVIYGVPFSDLGPRQLANLHTYWDKAFRFDAKDGKIFEVYKGPGKPQERPKNPDEGIIKEEGDRIMAQFPPESLWELQLNTTPRTWAEESYTIACLFAYPIGPHPTDVEAVTIKPDYSHHAHDIACQRIALAGYRLGDLLNQLFANTP